MKILHLSLRLLCLTALAFAVTGCIWEDRSGCPPPGPNVKVAFTLFDGGVFTDEITSVVAVLFDGQGTYISPAITLDKAALERYTGVELALAPGDYRMVFWANTGDNTEIRVVDGTPVITYKNFDGTEQQVLGNGDPVWYAPAVSESRTETDVRPLRYYEFTVPASGNYTGEVAFTEAHNAMNIYIAGLPADAARMPTVEITNLAPAVTFHGMQPLDDPLPTVISAVPTAAVQMNDAVYALAAFDTFALKDMAGMDLVVRDAAGIEIFRIPLADAVAQSGAKPNVHEISLLLTFGEVNVTIGIWDWDDKDLDKEW